MSSVYDFTVSDAGGQPKSLEDYRGRVLLIVNTASKCGFTPQFEGLEALYKQYHDQGLTILGFPCNQFGKQDPGSNAEIQEFCQLNYGVSFPMLGKIEVNGDGAAPLYAWLKQEQPGDGDNADIVWNFEKFLVDATGDVVARFPPTTTPEQLAEVLDQYR